MSYSQTELDRLVGLYNIIESGKGHEYAAPTYRDSPYLTEMANTVLNHTETDVGTLKESIPVLWYLADCYDKMCRCGMSVRFYTPLLCAYVSLTWQNGLEDCDRKDFEDCFYSAVKARNYYTPDDCADLIEIVTAVLPSDKVNELYENARKSRSSVKYDSVEKTDEYLTVIDDVERKIDENKTMDFCLEYWNLKGRYLSEYGIDWCSPVQLNPGVMFD